MSIAAWSRQTLGNAKRSGVSRAGGVTAKKWDSKPPDPGPPAQLPRPGPGKVGQVPPLVLQEINEPFFPDSRKEERG